MLLGWLIACGAPAPETSAGGDHGPGHATEWTALVAAAERGDVATVQVLARDLSLGAVAEDHPAASRLGSAIGFLQLAEDPEELADGVAQAREACEACHAERAPGQTVR